MPTSAISCFDNTLDRAMALVRLQIEIDNMIKNETFTAIPMKDPNDLARSAIVLAISAFDSYFTDKYAEVLVPYIKQHGPTKGIADLLTRAGLDTLAALDLLTMKKPYRRVRTLVDSYLSKHTTQRFDAIDALFLSIGLASFSTNVEQKARRRTLKRSIEILVLRRHAIVHSGDLNSHGRVQALDVVQMLKRLGDLIVFTHTAETLIDDRVKRVARVRP